MRDMKKITIIITTFAAALFLISFGPNNATNTYNQGYYRHINELKEQQELLLQAVAQMPARGDSALTPVREALQRCRNKMKEADFWLRYLEPINYKKINGPLPVEWETEVFEKFEKPYRREGGGFTLAAGLLEEAVVSREQLSDLVRASLEGIAAYYADSVTRQLKDHHHFFLCNRLYLLDLAAIYTTGFECPDTDQVLPELRLMMQAVEDIYLTFNESYPATPLTEAYLRLYRKAKAFAAHPATYTAFDHFTFIRDYINPLYRLNQDMIRDYHIVSRSMVDYSLNKAASSIFDKSLYNGSGAKGLFLRVKDTADLALAERVGKLLFFDPVLSGNNQRSCASCHKPEACFTDNDIATAPRFDRQGPLPRNTPSLVNATYNHLLMLDGAHISLQNQARGVMTNPDEMGGEEQELLQKVLSCAEYRNAFKKLLPYTPQEPEITMDHVISAITLYYGRFSNYTAPFDAIMNAEAPAPEDVKQGFNLFMGKAQCGTCHFVPQFNGVKPPYIGSEFEVLGVPADTAYRSLSPDKGRYEVHPAAEMLHAFRTGTVRNAARTAPYMHNGVFGTLEQVIDFYDAGGGQGRGLPVPNQTLSADSLHLSTVEKRQLIAFIKSLNEQIPPENPPLKLPRSSDRKLNGRKPGGLY